MGIPIPFPVNEYFQMKAQWKSITPKQESHFAAFRERKVQIEKDICRTDRDHHFFEGDNNENVKILNNVLMTYVMYNFDLGYVQGMSDLLSPILYVMQNEVDAFWCFVGFMDIVKSNFDFDQKGMKAQLAQLVATHLVFKREFKYKDVMKLWEVLWTGLPGKNFHLILCLAILDGEMCTILENNFGFTEILKHINDMAHNINLDFVLKKAEALHIKIKGSPPEYGVSNEVREILGLPPITPLAEAKKQMGKNPLLLQSLFLYMKNNSSSINKLELLSQSRSNPHEDHQHQTLRTTKDKVNMNRNCPENYQETTQDSLNETNLFVHEILNRKSELVEPVVTPRFVPTCDKELLIGLGDIVSKTGVRVQSHISECKQEIQWVAELEKSSKHYADAYDCHGLLTERTIMAHGIDKIGLGTDCSGGYSPSLINAMRFAIITNKNLMLTEYSNEYLTFEDALYFATRGSAKVACAVSADTPDIPAALMSFVPQYSGCLSSRSGITMTYRKQNALSGICFLTSVSSLDNVEIKDLQFI
ncbi:TBC1D15 [Lepeophtheirus salmonis]|uniref:TBC1D15 n=1 Tax=Lepeophtheirus salmonis TaxID=72036 RepID=A0A7R8HDK5_LEPSM|nr:TBC1D15 [Lepeophtheirus salmonis]CAF3027916.1 TBC1D15 [Lepeophtheirus salmonis]